MLRSVAFGIKNFLPPRVQYPAVSGPQQTSPRASGHCAAVLGELAFRSRTFDKSISVLVETTGVPSNFPTWHFFNSHSSLPPSSGQAAVLQDMVVACSVVGGLGPWNYPHWLRQN